MIGIITGILGCLFAWMLMGNPPPFKNPIPYLDLLWRILHAHLYLVLLMINPPSYLEDAVAYLLVFTQWFIIGQFGWWIFNKFRGKNENVFSK